MIRADVDDNLWLVDDMANTVTKCDRSGQRLLVLRPKGVVLKEAAGMKTEAPDCPHNIDDCIAKCGWFDMEAQVVWHKNVTAKISGDTVVLSPPLDADGCAVVEGGAAPTAVRCE